MNGLMDDLEYEQASRQAIAVMSGVVDRIYKVTSPGKRDNGPFSPAQAHGPSKVTRPTGAAEPREP